MRGTNHAGRWSWAVSLRDLDMFSSMFNGLVIPNALSDCRHASSGCRCSIASIPRKGRHGRSSGSK
jgi:hypothetical protein